MSQRRVGKRDREGELDCLLPRHRTAPLKLAFNLQRRSNLPCLRQDPLEERSLFVIGVVLEVTNDRLLVSDEPRHVQTGAAPRPISCSSRVDPSMS
jgi:hypothetical protein